MQMSLDDILIALDSVRTLQTTRGMFAPSLGSRPEVVELIDRMIAKTGLLLRMAQLD